MAASKTKFTSLTTPGVKQDISNYLVELVFIRANKGMLLPPKFWQETRHKFKYRREIQACRKFIKKYGPAAILKAAMNNYIATWTDFATIEVYLQRDAESKIRLAAPKDNSELKVDFVKSEVDLRNYTPKEPKKTLFERLAELENG